MAGDRESTALDRATVVALAAMSLGIFVVANDFTALTVAVVEIEQDLDSTLNRAQWVINSYTVVFGVLIVTGGRLSDLLGRRRMFIWGAAIFATFSLLGGFAPNIEALIAARAFMGVGGALMWPSVLGMTYGLLPEDRAGLAGGLVVGVAGIGNAMGPLIAGFLTDTFSWRWVFFVNVPIALAAIAIIRSKVAESVPSQQQGLDYRGIATLSAAVVLVLVALDRGTQVGFGSLSILLMFVLGACLLALFGVIERRQGVTALVPRRILSSRQFTSALVSVLMMSAIYFGILLYIPQFTQKQLGWSALEAGAGLLPVMLVFATASFLAGSLYNWVGARIVIGVGASALTIGVLWLALTIGSGYLVLVPGLVVVGVGVGLYYSATTTAAVTSVASEDNSLAGGIIFMGNVAGGALGIGLNTAIVLAAADFADGIRNAFLVDATLGLIGTVVAVALIRDQAELD